MNESTILNLNEFGVSRQSACALRAFDAAITAAILEAVNQGLQQGFIVATLHGHAHYQTGLLVAGGDPVDL